MLTSLYSLFYVTGECYRFLHRGGAEILGKQNSLFPSGPVIKCLISPYRSDTLPCRLARRIKRRFHSENASNVFRL